MSDKIAVITDTHAGARGDSSLFLDAQEKFYDNVFFPTLIERGITTIVHCGDYFDRRKFINFRTLYRNQQMFMEKLVEHNIHMYLVAGNHDIFYKNTNYINSPSMLFGQYLSHVTIVEDDCFMLDEENGLVLVPWINDQNKDKIYTQLDEMKPKVCFGHFEFAGFEMYKGQKIDHGMNSDDFALCPMVLSGHYHHKSTKGNVTYLGSAFEFTWADYNDDRGFHILDRESKELEYIKNPYRMFHKIIYDDLKGMPDPSEFEYIKDTIVKVVVAKKQDSYKFDLYLTDLLQYEPHDLQIVDLEVEYASTTLSDEEIESRSQDTREFLGDYVTSMTNMTDDVKADVGSLLDRLYVESLDED